MSKNKLTLTQRVLISMLKENTGRHFLDSGCAYGRNWEHNQYRSFIDESYAWYEVYENQGKADFNITKSVFHFLDDCLEYDKNMQRRFMNYAKKVDPDNNKYWLELMEQFPNYLSKNGFEVDNDLVPGGQPEDIDVWVRNITSADIEDIRVEIDPDENEVDIDDDTADFERIRAGSRSRASYETEIAGNFKGYVNFTVNIRIDRQLVNIESFTYYFGMQSQYVTFWVEDDDNNNRIPEPGEKIEFQIARWNPTEREVENVKVILATSDANVDIDENFGDYDDLLPNEVAKSDRDYEFTVEDEADFTGLDDEKGYVAEFTLQVEEDNENMGEETFTFRIGGIMRYLPPDGFDELMGNISDRISLDQDNNGNGLPEPGETIEIEITLANISEVFDAKPSRHSNHETNRLSALGVSHRRAYGVRGPIADRDGRVGDHDAGGHGVRRLALVRRARHAHLSLAEIGRRQIPRTWTPSGRHVDRGGQHRASGNTLVM